MTERVECNSKTCKAQILVSTAIKNDGYCMPCVQRMENEARRQYIEKHRKSVDPYEGISDPVELIKRYHEKRPHDPLVEYLPLNCSIESVYRNLSEFEEYRLIKYAIQQAESGYFKPIETICIELTAFRSSKLSMLHKYMLKRKIYCPSIIFKDAGSDVVKTLLNEVYDDSDNRNLILQALAWSNSKDVTIEFSQWRNNAPRWSDELHLPPYEYSKEAGWELEPSNTKRNLFFDKCYPLLSAKCEPSSTKCNTCTPSDSECKWCGRQLTNLLEIDLTASQFDFLELKGELLRLTTCDACAPFSGALYMDFDTLGNSQWSRFNSEPEYLPEDINEWERLPEMPLVMSDETRPAHYAANQFLSTTFSQIGGMPAWIQDSSYPACPCCQNTMMFVAQISNEEIDEYSEGTYYLYICRDCKISAVNYQQS